jgi:ABC-type amino acid transport substrate-binding protein
MGIASVTPFGYREVLGATRNVLITAFLTNSVFVVLPQLSAGLSSLMEQCGEEDSPSSVGPDCIVPLGYPFPDVGKILSLLFIPFAVWFYTGAVSLRKVIAILPQGLVMTFGKLVATIPALLEAQKLPSDIFQLFLMSGVYAARLGDLLGVMHITAFTLLTWSGVRGLLKIRLKQTIILLSVATILTATSIVGIRTILNYTFKDSFSKAKILGRMAVLEEKATANIVPKAVPNPVPLGQGQSRLDRIAQTGKMRIGFNPDRLPFSFKNSRGDLVGLDVNLAYHLAKDLNASIVFVPYDMSNLVKHLRADHFDIAISGVTMTLKRAMDITFSEPYFTVNFALVVKDYQRREFASLAAVRSMKDLRLGVQEGQYFGERARFYFENAKISELQSERDFFTGQNRNLDALVTSAEGGSAWTLLYPSYKVVNPLTGTDKIPLGFALAGDDQDLEHFLAVWVRLKKDDGTIRRLKDYWIFGVTAAKKQPRWSIIRNVLGLVE